jgi:L-ascorbate metabolism protein UlaG (beta-lactamase superfamily)
MHERLEGITWFRQSGIRVARAGLQVYVDPIAVPHTEPADFILLTHPHYDNFSEEDVARIRGPETVVIAPVSMRKLVEDAEHLVRPGDVLQLGALDLLVTPAYNRDRRFHPLDSGWVGYVFTLGGVTYYHAGDTDFVEELTGIRCDIAFLPCDGQYTMTPQSAAEAGRSCEAEWVIPIRWGDHGGGREAADQLADLLPDRVAILDPAAET